MNLKDASVALAVVSAAIKLLEQRERELRNTVAGQMMVVGSTQSKPAPFGEALATISLVRSGARATVTDERELLAWAKKQHPDWVAEAIRPEVKKILLKSLSDSGGVAVTPQGEVVGGVAFTPGGAYVTTRPDIQAVRRAYEPNVERRLPPLETFMLPEGGGK